ncbi:hypothetical protein ABBQ38_013604 [Trebouxia sp. C0009 RCD-2024]
MLEFCSGLEHVYNTVAPKMDAINISTNVTSLSQLWADAQHHRNFQDNDGHVRSSIEAVFQQSLKQLQPRMNSVGAQAISNIVWSSAKLGLDPDKYMPGMVRILTSRFMQLVHAADKRQHPSAQGAANLVWALARMHHAAATSELLDAVSSYFGSLIYHPDKWQRPNPQSIANMVWALAQLKHSPKDARLLDDLCVYMHSLLIAQGSRDRPGAQAVANMLWGLAVLQHPLKDPGGRLLDDLCMYMHSLLQAEDLRSRPNAQDVANVLWAVAQLKHAPPGEVGSAMLDHLVALCVTPRLQPKPQEISNCFLACAELDLALRPAQMGGLWKHLLGLHVSKVDIQSYSNAAWSLAVMGWLDFSMLDAVLHQLRLKHKLLLAEYGTIGTSTLLKVEDATQLHQALEWLRPAKGSEQMEAWSNLRSRLQAVSPDSHIQPLSFPGQADFYRALAAQRLQYKAKVLCGVYYPAAVLYPHDSKAAKVILVLQRPDAYLTNAPSRLLGRVAFKNKILGRHGTVVTVPYKQGNSSVESMADAIKAAVEAKTGLPLDSFRH